MQLRYKLLGVLLISSLTTLMLRAQEVLVPRAYESTNVGIVYDQEVSFPIVLQLRGFQVGFNKGTLKTYYKTGYYGISAGILRHPRESQQSNSGRGFAQGGASYIYGKQRTLIPIRAYKGWKRYYSGKEKRRGVGIGTVLELGATAGIGKAYTIQAGLSNDVQESSTFITYEENPEAFLNQARIEGSGGIRRGWNDIAFYPGINAKAALHLDWGAFEEYMRAVEAGITVDFFFREVEILTPPAENTPLFVNFYLALHLGKRR